MRTAINAAIIKSGKILLVRKNQTWILPGGKPESKENDLECLCREISEELSGTKIQNIGYYNEFKGKTPHKGDIIKSRVYFADIKGELYDVPENDSVSECKWINDFYNYNLSKSTAKIIKSLKKYNYL